MTEHPARTVTTTGQGTARMVPDAAVVRVSVTHRADGVAEAFAGVDAAARMVGQVGRDFTESAKIASLDLNVYPAHDNQGQPAGFEARHALMIGCADLTAAGELLTQLARHVGNRLAIDGISLEVTDRSPAVSVARQAAFADARARAEHLARLAGGVLGPALSVSEGGAGGGAHERFAEMAKFADEVLEPGETSISASVTVTWGFGD